MENGISNETHNASAVSNGNSIEPPAAIVQNGHHHQHHNNNNKSISGVTGTESHECTQCEDLPSRWKCQQCQIGLCDKCVKGHLKIPVCKNHNTIPIPPQNLVDKSTATKITTECDIHKEPVTLNCTSCDQMICIKCEMGGQHSDHVVENMEKAFENLMQTIQMNGEQADDNLWELEEKMKLLDIQIDKTEQLYTTVKNTINNRSDEIIKSIQDNKLELLSTLENSRSESVDRLENIKREILNDMNGCAKTKSDLDSKKVALISNIGADFRTLKSDQLEPNSLSLDKITVENPLFKPTSEQNNRIGEIEFQTADFKLKPKQSRRNSIGLPEMLINKKLNCEKEILIPYGSSFHFGVVGDDLWVPVHGEDSIRVYSGITGEMKKTIEVSGMTTEMVWGIRNSRSWQSNLSSGNENSVYAPRAVKQMDDNTVILACDSGLYVMGTTGKIRHQLDKGSFCDIAMNEDRDKIYALDYSNKKCRIYSLKSDTCLNGNIDSCNGGWDSKRFGDEGEGFVLNNCKVDQYGSVTVVKDGVVICPGGSHVVYRFSFDGELLDEYGCYGRGEPGQLWGPSLCTSDHHGNILIADVNNKRLQILNISNRKWLVIYVEQLTCPFDVKITGSGIWALSQHNGSKYKLMKYVYGNNEK